MTRTPYRAVAGALVLVACAHEQPVVSEPRPTPPAPVTAEAPGLGVEAEARVTVTTFLEAAERRDFAAAYGLLAGALRDRYTPQRLEADFDAEPLAKERLARIRASLQAPMAISASRASLSLGAQKSFTLIREAGQWKVVRVAPNS